MKNSLFKKAVSALMALGIVISSTPTVLAGDLAEQKTAPDFKEAESLQTEATTDAAKEKDSDLIELANALANGTHTYHTDTSHSDLAIKNQTMSLQYGLLAGSDEQYVKSFANTQGKNYIENTFDVFAKNAAGEKFYASSSISGTKANIFRYGYYYCENRIEGQSFVNDIISDPNFTYNVDLSSTSTKHSIASYNVNADGSAYFITDDVADDVFFGYTTLDKDGKGLNTANYDYIEFEIKAESAGTSGQIFIVAGDETTFNSKQCVSFSFINDGNYHVYRIPLTGISDYTKNLTEVRIDVNSAVGSRVDIKYVKVFKAKIIGMAPELTIQRSFLTYSDKLHHLTQFSTTKEITDVSEVGMETKIDASRVNAIVVKDATGLKYTPEGVDWKTTLEGVDWKTAEYVGFDIDGAGIFGYILPCDNKSGSLEVILDGEYCFIVQTLEVTEFTPSEKDTKNGNDLFFGQRIYNDEGHDFAAFIHNAECERHPLTKENIVVDVTEDGHSYFVGYDALYGFYRFNIAGAGFNQSYYDYPNRQYNVRFTVEGDELERQMYFMTRCTMSGCIESAVLLNDMDMLLPIPIEVSKNFSGDGEANIYNIDDAIYGEAYFPIIVNAGEKRTYNLVNLYQNWGQFPLKQISSIQFHTPYYHLSTGVTETNCIQIFPNNAPGLPDHRAMSAPFWSNQPQHNSGGSHSFLRYTDKNGETVSSINSTASIDSYGPTYADVTLGFNTNDGAISATYTHTEMPQTDENRAYYEMKYTFNRDISFSDFAHDFVFYRVTDNNSSGFYQKVGYLDKDNNYKVVDAVSDSNQSAEYLLGDNCPYFSFFMMPNWNRESASAQGYTNLSMLFKDWTVISYGEEIEVELLLINTKNHLTLAMNLGNISFKAGDTITINAILMPWGSQQMEDDPANRLNNAQTAIYSSPTYSSKLPDGSLYMDKNVRDVRENSLLNPLSATALENASVIDSAFVPKIRSTNGQSATFKVSGGYNNNTVRVYGFNKLTVPKIEELVDGQWIEYTVSSKSTPDAYGYGYNYDGYMVHYEGNGEYSYSFVFNMTDTDARTFRISATEDFNGWEYDPAEIKESPMNVFFDASSIYSIARDNYFTKKTISDDGSYVSLELKPSAAETYIELYSGGPCYPTGQYAAYKYRIPTTNKESTGTVEFWSSTSRTSAGGSDYLTIQNSAVQEDGKWHVMIVDLSKLKNTNRTFSPNDNGTYCARYLRIDTTSNQAAEGDYIDIGFVGISDSIAEIIAASGNDVASFDLVNSDKASYTSISPQNYIAPTGATTVYLESASIHRCNEFTVKLKVKNNAGLNYLRVAPKFDSEILTLKSVTNGDALLGMSRFEGSFIWQDSTAFSENGTIATFTFGINEGVDADSFEIELVLIDAFGESVSELNVVSMDSTVKFIEHAYGDCNGDNLINAVDLTKLRQYLAHYNYDTRTAGVTISDGADVNGDGFIDALDLTALRKYFAGYDYSTQTPTYPLGRK